MATNVQPSPGDAARSHRRMRSPASRRCGLTVRAGEIGPVRREIIFEPVHEQPAPAEPAPAEPATEPAQPKEPVPSQT